MEFLNITVPKDELDVFVEKTIKRYEKLNLDDITIVELVEEELKIENGCLSTYQDACDDESLTIYYMLDDWCEGSNLGYNWERASNGNILYATCEW